jgi:glycerate-2-kinase
MEQSAAPTDLEGFLRDIFDAAIAAVDPRAILAPYLPRRPKGRVVVMGAGKATARMAQAVEAAWGPCEGLIAVPHGASLPL